MHIRNGLCLDDVLVKMRAPWNAVHATQESQRIWQDILSGKAEQSPASLARCLVLSYADLKRFRTYYS